MRADPGMVTRIIVRFEGFAGRYVWHCHVLEHEDNEMMRPYDVTSFTALDRMNAVNPDSRRPPRFSSSSRRKPPEWQARSTILPESSRKRSPFQQLPPQARCRMSSTSSSSCRRTARSTTTTERCAGSVVLAIVSRSSSRRRSVWQQQSRKTGKRFCRFTWIRRRRGRNASPRSITAGHRGTRPGIAANTTTGSMRSRALTMGYYKEADIPFQFALANAFTICDAYFCSVMGPTDPNRIYHWTGSINPPGNQAGALIDNDIAEKYVASWITCPERLEKAGISWRVYQKGIDNDSKRPFDGNYGDNPLVYFKQYLHSAQDSKLRREALSPHPLSELARDVASGQLPQVSWIVAPEAFSEHPAWPPAYGAQYTAEVLDALTGNPKVWSKTVLFINYDENDGYFDHVVPPTPPISRDHGRSTVDASDEIYDDPKLGPTPYGLGVRVPMVVVSPWTRGGWVCSEVFDHTSVLRFLEARFGAPMRETNITAWRRSVCGDLTSAFDFSKPSDSFPRLPDTSSTARNR